MSILNMHHLCMKILLNKFIIIMRKKAVLISGGRGELVYKEFTLQLEEMLNFETVNCSILK